jgi:hypothetical protein
MPALVFTLSEFQLEHHEKLDYYFTYLSLY